MKNETQNYLKLLSEVTDALTSSNELEANLTEILIAFKKFLGLNRGTITLLQGDSKTAYIAASAGLSSKEKLRGTYKIGEGITGYVLETGSPIIIPLISKDPRFLNKTKSRNRNQELSFICVPIRSNKRVIGALSADRDYEESYLLDNDLEILKITTSIISHMIELNDVRELERNRLMIENEKLKSELHQKFEFSNIIGHSDKMNEVFKLLSQVTKSNATVMIRGESGTGKELIAHAIHYNSDRSQGPFIKLNCSALPESLLESELFGYVKGAFTGANQNKEGKFEAAQNGTLFLDEIGDIPHSTQVKLLRILQSKELERLGSNKTIPLNVRVIVATNRDLESMISSGEFREDLYYRINVFPIFMPSLKERKTDILMLAEFFLDKYAKENNKTINRITTQAINLLMSYHWPGNVRELENCIERSVLVCEDSAIRASHLPPTLQFDNEKQKSDYTSLTDAVSNLEQEMIIEFLKRTHGNQRSCSKELGITERILGYKIKKYNIDPKYYV